MKIEVRSLTLVFSVLCLSVFGEASETAFVGTFAGKDSHGMQNVGIGYSAYYAAYGTNSVAIGQASASRALGSVRNVFIGQDSGRDSTNLFGCVGIGDGVFCGSAALTNAISIGNRLVFADDHFFITPDEMRPSFFAPIWWYGGNLVLQADSHAVLSCPSSVVVKAGHEVAITNAALHGVKHCDWTPRMAVESGALVVYTNGVRAGSIQLQ